MYIKVTDGIPKKYSLKQLRIDNPNVGFPTIPSNEVLEVFDVFPLKSVAQPIVDHTKKVEEGVPQKLESGEWVQTWIILDATEEEIIENIRDIKNDIKTKRKRLYQDEADPLFFKWKRGEADEQDYINKIAEIKAKYPYPNGIE